MNQDKNETNPTKKSSHIFDIVVWIGWGVLVWGFLASLAFIASPKDSAGIHEVIILAYFLGFTFFFGLLYYMALKRGI
ncbi:MULTISPECIES: hypothetical protein [Sutcliffiella]|uniref:Uncharacterized protein n=1 Tax=Sutcliffiella cohnii TaxID=33932 RepID=A0A223KNN9_9BACI|nr:MULTISPECIES: hypothetical protein [Sutcliffiella]AST91017.1 hypothetical protein BC6307_06855 [Sutcliffiella cohnii]WBL16813.1 hypothetical protein O1A01_09330 [Sutcliffiella sp. NC1]